MQPDIHRHSGGLSGRRRGSKPLDEGGECLFARTGGSSASGAAGARECSERGGTETRTWLEAGAAFR